VKTEQTEGRQPMTWSTVKWAVTKTAVQRIQERIFRAAKMTKRRRLEPYAGGLARTVLRGRGGSDAAPLPDIEPWWKVLRSLALKGRRFETWAEIEQAVERATAYWNEHKHPFIWGRRRRHRQSRRLGVAALPAISLI
jgi:hypothetical protein